MTARPTSAEALRDAEASGKLNGKRFEVALAFQLYGPGTSAEVLRAAGLDANRNLMRARVTELADLGWLTEEEPRRCKVTGRRAIVWRFERTEPRPKAPPVKDLLAGLSEVLEIAADALYTAHKAGALRIGQSGARPLKTAQLTVIGIADEVGVPIANVTSEVAEPGNDLEQVNLETTMLEVKGNIAARDAVAPC